MEQELETRKEHNKTLNEDLSNKGKDMEGLKLKLESSKEEKFRQEKEQFENELNKLKLTLSLREQEILEEKTHYQSDHLGESEKFRAKISENETEVEKLKAKRLELEKEIEGSVQVLARVEGEYQEIQKENQVFIQTLGEREKDIAELQIAIQEKEEQEKEIIKRYQSDSEITNGALKELEKSV